MPERGAYPEWRSKVKRQLRLGWPISRLLVAFALSALAAGCGQYYGVHQGTGTRDRVQLASANGGGDSNQSPPAYAKDDGARGPAPGAITGDATLLAKHRTVPPLVPGNGKGRAPPPAKGGSKGAGGSSTSGNARSVGRSRGNGSPGSTSNPTYSVPKSVQDVLRRGANYNSTILPKGFPFLICPVQGRYSYSDDYGAPRFAGGYHPHAGNDIFAGQGTPIVAPFSGYAVRDPNTLGGNAVRVEGGLGFVYNAHLVAYAPSVPGQVQAGDVVGFVGNTGDAQGTSYHDHFEWHPKVVHPYDKQIPGTNGAVDPFSYLRVVCPPS